MSVPASLRIAALTCLVLTALSGPALAYYGLAQDFVRLDRAYIPALMSAEEGNRAEFVEAIKHLNTEWARFQEDNPRGVEGYPVWSHDMERVSAFIGAATKIAAGGGSLKEAYLSLHEVRVKLRSTRKGLHLKYFLDSLTAYEQPLSDILSRTEGKTGETLTYDDLVWLGLFSAVANRRWGRVGEAEFDLALHGFDEAMAGAMQRHFDTEAKGLQRLKEALDAEDFSAILTAAATLKPAFSSILRLFGEFPEQRE